MRSSLAPSWRARAPLESGWDREADLSSDPRRFGVALAGAPDRERLVAVAEQVGGTRPSAIELGIWIREAELVAQELDLGGIPREEQPARIVDAVRAREAVEGGRRVFLRPRRERVDEDGMVHLGLEQRAHLLEVGCRRGTDVAAARVHEVEDHDLVLEQIVVELIVRPPLVVSETFGK